MVAGFYLIGRTLGHRSAIAWIVAGSLFFYSWWIPQYCPLIVASMVFNFLVGTAINNATELLQARKKKILLVLGLVVNLGLLGYYKYTVFGLELLNQITNGFFGTVELDIILPLGISFFTFQQIGFLVDSYRGETHRYNLLDYCAFICFFPQWIAGPIVLHHEILPQLASRHLFRISQKHLALALSFFIVGLAKKVLIADHLSPIVSAAFSSPGLAYKLSFFEAWGGLLAYTFQIYFDFSGYCDMAIGLGLLFNVKLPLNFFSPYRSTSIIEFWRRWHITLSRFLKNYLYIPLGGNKKGKFRRYVNLLTVMLLGGVWHGAGWTFVAWGGLHGICLAANHVWRDHNVGAVFRWVPDKIYRGACWAITFTCVIFAWVFFRADTMSHALAFFRGLSGANGFVFPSGFLGMFEFLLPEHWQTLLKAPIYSFREMTFWVLIAAGFTAFPRNFFQMTARFSPATGNPAPDARQPSQKKVVWEPRWFWAVGLGVLAALALMNLSNPSEFLYFQF